MEIVYRVGVLWISVRAGLPAIPLIRLSIPPRRPESRALLAQEVGDRGVGSRPAPQLVAAVRHSKRARARRRPRRRVDQPCPEWRARGQRAAADAREDVRGALRVEDGGQIPAGAERGARGARRRLRVAGGGGGRRQADVAAAERIAGRQRSDDGEAGPVGVARRELGEVVLRAPAARPVRQQGRGAGAADGRDETREER